MRMRMIASVFLLLLLAGNRSWAFQSEQSTPAALRGPVMGYVLDTALQAVRPINGIPGSSALGEPVSLPFPVSAAAFSASGDFALAVPASDKQPAMVLRSIGSENIIQPIDGAITGTNMVILNVDGSAAALVASATRQLQIVRGLPDSPAPGSAIDLSSITGTISALAVDQAGSNILIAVSADHGGLYLVNDQQTRPLLVAEFGSPSALALLNQDQNVIVADAAVDEITIIRNFASAPETFHVAGGRDGISGPAGLQVSKDGRKLYIADGASRTLDVWNFDAQSIEASYALDAEPTRIRALQGSSTFILNDVGDHPLLLLDAVNSATYFVPAGKDRN